MYSVKMFRDDGVCINDVLLGISSFFILFFVAVVLINVGEVVKS